MKRRAVLWIVRAVRGAACAAALATLARPGVQAQAGKANQAIQRLQLESRAIALTARQSSEGIVLQADGRTFAIDLTTGNIGREVYRVPAGYRAVDVAGGLVRGIGPVLCFTVNVRSGAETGSFVLQVAGVKQETWSWLPARGVYVGVALDTTSGFAYASNSTTNGIYKVRVGEKKIPTLLATIGSGVRLGAIAVDPAGGRLYVSDMGAQRLYSVELRTGAVTTLSLPGVEEVRGIVWHAPTRRLYVADSGSEVLWAVTPSSPAHRPEEFLRDKRLRQPAGLTAAPDGSLWVADERTGAIYQVSVPQKSIVRTVRWNPVSGRS